jgi:hypothetical protein
MNPAHLHLVATHILVVGTLLGLCLFVFALCRKSEELKRTSLLAFFLAALLALPAYFSGTPAANKLKRMMLGISLDACDQHLEIAILALTASLVLGAASLAGLLLFRKGKSLPLTFVLLVLMLALVSSGLLTWTANLGAKIRHTEIRSQIKSSHVITVRFRWAPVARAIFHDNIHQ